MRYYHSGINQYGHVKILAEEGVAGMINGKTAHQPKMQKALEEFDCPLVLDSGAFQGVTNLDKYIELVYDLRDRIEWYVVLDQLQNQFTTDLNQFLMEDAGLTPLWVYQVDGGTGLYMLYRKAKKYGFVGVGGLVKHAMSDAASLLDRIEKIGLVLAEARAEAHFFGIGSSMILRSFRDEPWFRSADSQKWLAGKRSHTLLTRSGDSINPPDRGLLFTGEECARQNIRQMERWLTDTKNDLFSPHLTPSASPEATY